MTGRVDGSSERLAAIVAGSASFMAVLVAVRDLGLASWCVGAGAVRDLVWNALDERSVPSPLADVDVAWFGPSAPLQEDTRLEAKLRADLPGVPWEVTNQAHVHRWFEAHFGQPVPPLASLDDAVASWPEYATSVGVWLDASDRVRVIAPHGFDDLFAMDVGRNPARVDPSTYRARIEQKRYRERWPRVTVVE